MTAGTFAGPLSRYSSADRIGRRQRHHGSRRRLRGDRLDLSVPGTPVPIMLCGFLLVSVMSLFLALGLGGYTPELFPTEYRFRGSGFGQMTGRAALIATPYPRRPAVRDTTASPAWSA